MCLKTRQAFPEFAEEDIVCYKVIYKEINDEGIKWVSPYRDYIWFRGEICDKSLKYVHTAEYAWYHRTTDNKLDFNGNREINAGFFHTFENLDDAFKMENNISGVFKGNFPKVFKCIIPKGTKYYKGYFNMVDPYSDCEIVCTNFASEKLKLVKICA